MARSILGSTLDTFESAVEKRITNKLLSIMDNDKLPLHNVLLCKASTGSAVTRAVSGNQSY